MSATEELRRLLDERGVEWETDRSGFRVMWGKPVDEFHDTMQFNAVDNALPNGGLNVHICGFMPEQAIAATLGSDREAELQKALNKAAGNWAKADDRLRKALDFMRIWISDDAHLGDSELSAAFEKAEGLRKLDAIESAIAATLGRRECEFVIDDNMNETEGMGDVWFRCTNCDTTFDYYADDWLMKQNYCPHCGFKIRKAVKR